MRLLLLFLAFGSVVSAQPVAPGADRPAAELSAFDAVVLGLVEGITEFLPVSSTGHLIIANRFLGLDSNEKLVDPSGRPLWYEPPSAEHPEGIPMTVELAADTYVVVIQFGAIAAVALLYWKAFLAMGRGLVGRDPEGRRLLANILIAFMPAAVVGLLAHDWIEEYLFSVGTVIAAQVAGALFMLYAERRQVRRVARFGPGRRMSELTARDAALIGALQCFALWPGTSRSMMAIVGGYFADLEARQAAEFSFLLGFVTLGAATAYKSLQGGAAMIAVFGWPHVLLGAAVAAVAAALAVRALVGFLNRFGLGLFATYRLVLAAVLALWFFA